MNRIKILILIILIVNLSNVCYSKSKNNTYINYTLGFKIKYPSQIQLGYTTEEFINLKLEKQFRISLHVNNIDELNAYPDSDMNFYEEFKKVEQKKGFMDESKEKYKNISFEYFKYKGKVIGQMTFFLNAPEADQGYSRTLEIKRKNYFIYFSVQYFDRFYSIPDRYPEYFEREEYEVEAKKKGGGMEKIMVKSDPEWKEPVKKNYVEFYNLIKNKSKKAPKELIKLWDYFDVIINSLELFEPAKYVTPSVKKLSLRKGASTNDERIRLISQGEKLEVLDDINPPELIGKDYGFWVKVKTEKGEIGWCFDAYLKPFEEVKKK